MNEQEDPTRVHIEANGTRLWFDVDGPVLVPDATGMRIRPTVVVVHGGPGSYDHSYFKPHFAVMTEVAQVVYVDLRDHGRSRRHETVDWSFEKCADDLRAFCDALGIDRPVVFGHSLGGIVAMLYGARHPQHAAALILQSTMARFDLARLVDGFRRVAGDDVAELARRDYGGDAIDAEQWGRVFAAFGPHVPSPGDLARRIQNRDLAAHGMTLLRSLDVIDTIGSIGCPTMVCVGELDPVTPVSAAHEIAAALPHVGRLVTIENAGHFPWLDVPDRYWPLVTGFITGAVATIATGAARSTRVTER